MIEDHHCQNHVHHDFGKWNDICQIVLLTINNVYGYNDTVQDDIKIFMIVPQSIYFNRYINKYQMDRYLHINKLR